MRVFLLLMVVFQKENLFEQQNHKISLVSMVSILVSMISIRLRLLNPAPQMCKGGVKRSFADSLRAPPFATGGPVCACLRAARTGRRTGR